MRVGGGDAVSGSAAVARVATADRARATSVRARARAHAHSATMPARAQDSHAHTCSRARANLQRGVVLLARRVGRHEYVAPARAQLLREPYAVPRRQRARVRVPHRHGARVEVHEHALRRGADNRRGGIGTACRDSVCARASAGPAIGNARVRLTYIIAERANACARSGRRCNNAVMNVSAARGPISVERYRTRLVHACMRMRGVKE